LSVFIFLTFYFSLDIVGNLSVEPNRTNKMA
jgi:hypothetical protein